MSNTAFTNIMFKTAAVLMSNMSQSYRKDVVYLHRKHCVLSVLSVLK